MESKRRKLNRQLVVFYTAMLASLFVALLIVVQLCALILTTRYAEDDLYSAQVQMDGTLNNIFGEVYNLYLRIVDSRAGLDDITNDSLSQAERDQIFDKIIEASSVDDRLFLGLSLHLDKYTYNYGIGGLVYNAAFLESLTSSYPKLGDVNKSGYLTVGMRFSTFPAGDTTGKIVFCLSTARLNETCNFADADQGYTFLMTKQGELMASSDGDLVGKEIFERNLFDTDKAISYKIINDRLSVVAIQSAESTNAQYRWDCYIVSVMYYDVLQHNALIISYVLLAISITLLVVSIGFAMSVASKTARPIKELSTAINNVRDTSNYDQTLTLNESSEMLQLETAYDDMINRLFDLWEQNKHNMDTQRRLEIDSLQLQINPHFLYNTLDAIAWMAKIKKEPEIEKLVLNLAKFFRLSLHKGDNFITVSEEIEIVERFIEIEKLRYPNTLVINKTVTDDVKDCKTLKLILQPIVENCIKHGFSAREGVGIITINVYSEHEDIVCTVSDDGEGFEVPPSFLKGELDATQQGGYGLRNVDERIRLEYGQQYGLSVVSVPQSGTTVTVRIARRN